VEPCKIEVSCTMLSFGIIIRNCMNKKQRTGAKPHMKVGILIERLIILLNMLIYLERGRHVWLGSPPVFMDVNVLH
jgi:hypothetical protein